MRSLVGMIEQICNQTTVNEILESLLRHCVIRA